MSVPGLLADYGYLAVFVGSLLEGETVLVLAGFAAHQGYLFFPWVVAVAFCGGTLGDQIFFFIGRRYGHALLRRLPRLADRAGRIDRLLLRHHAALIVGVRFMYGLRIVGPIVIGMSQVPARRFLLFNMIGAAIWAPLVAGAGFLFGRTMQGLFEGLERYEWIAALAIVGIVGLVTLAHRVCTGRRR
ncbi:MULTISPECIES: DedA family protein [unclassified Variovorax]|uniref:DedA family protein n=1 Tax=unclassified Variovorax TaxID=663243 RepID=UPI003F4540E7